MWVVSHLAGCGVSSTAAFTSWVCDKSYLIILLLILLVTIKFLIFAALEMQRTLQLQCTFALYPAAGFINTGLVVVQQQQMKPANKQQQKKQKKKKPKASNNNRTNNRRLQNHMESSCLVDDDDDVPLADLLSLERAEINQLQQ